jgi:plastocyanin
MKRNWGVLATASLAAVAMALPAAASARTKTVYAGEPPSADKALQKYGAAVNDFFLHKVTINRGDTIKFVLNGFHTIDLPGKSGQDVPLIVPGKLVTGVTDFAGTPFWFNGKVPSLGFNPILFGPSGPSSYNGSARIDTGLPLGPPKPLNVTFTKPGVYRYFCDVHPGMVGTVVVLAKGKPVPSSKQDAAALKKQVARDVASAAKLFKVKAKGTAVSLGQSDANGVEDYGMFPAKLTVKAGTVVTFSMSADTREVHTASFGPAPYLTVLANSFNGPAPSQAGFYPSDPGTISLSPTSHGNGFANTGALDRDPTTPLPPSGKIKFTAPGTYRFICLIHPFMHGTIVVK